MSLSLLPLAWHGAWAGGGGFHPWFFIFPFFWLAWLGAIVAGAVLLIRYRGQWRQRWTGGAPADEAGIQHARAILHERYARGEISTEEYRERMEQLS